jgi:hypothetical protein
MARQLALREARYFQDQKEREKKELEAAARAMEAGVPAPQARRRPKGRGGDGGVYTGGQSYVGVDPATGRERVYGPLTEGSFSPSREGQLELERRAIEEAKERLKKLKEEQEKATEEVDKLGLTATTPSFLEKYPFAQASTVTLPNPTETEMELAQRIAAAVASGDDIPTGMGGLPSTMKDPQARAVLQGALAKAFPGQYQFPTVTTASSDSPTGTLPSRQLIREEPKVRKTKKAPPAQTVDDSRVVERLLGVGGARDLDARASARTGRSLADAAAARLGGVVSIEDVEDAALGGSAEVSGLTAKEREALTGRAPLQFRGEVISSEDDDLGVEIRDLNASPTSQTIELDPIKSPPEIDAILRNAGVYGKDYETILSVAKAYNEDGMTDIGSILEEYAENLIPREQLSGRGSFSGMPQRGSDIPPGELDGDSILNQTLEELGLGDTDDKTGVRPTSRSVRKPAPSRAQKKEVVAERAFEVDSPELNPLPAKERNVQDEILATTAELEELEARLGPYAQFGLAVESMNEAQLIERSDVFAPLLGRSKNSRLGKPTAERIRAQAKYVKGLDERRDAEGARRYKEAVKVQTAYEQSVQADMEKAAYDMLSVSPPWNKTSEKRRRELAGGLASFNEPTRKLAEKLLTGDQANRLSLTGQASRFRKLRDDREIRAAQANALANKSASQATTDAINLAALEVFAEEGGLKGGDAAQAALVDAVLDDPDGMMQAPGPTGEFARRVVAAYEDNAVGSKGWQEKYDIGIGLGGSPTVFRKTMDEGIRDPMTTAQKRVVADGLVRLGAVDSTEDGMIIMNDSSIGEQYGILKHVHDGNLSILKTSIYARNRGRGSGGGVTAADYAGGVRGKTEVPPPRKGVLVVNTQEEFDALPPDTRYQELIDGSWVIRRTPKVDE